MLEPILRKIIKRKFPPSPGQKKRAYYTRFFVILMQRIRVLRYGLNRSRYLARAQTLRAHVYASHGAVFTYTNRLNIRVPLAPRVAIRVGNVIAGHLPFAADCTLS
jgi:hypothetical protein